MAVYTHGHHESVLRSHRWRTAENSAAYLLGHLRPGLALLALYRRVARANGGEPDAGRRLLSWAYAAGFTEVTAGASTWCFATPEDRAWWAGLWSERMVGSALARHAVSGGHATLDDLRGIAAAWQEWARADDAWFTVLHGEVLGRG